MAGVLHLDGKGTFDLPLCTRPVVLEIFQFRTKNWGGTKGPVTRTRLASQLGKRIAEFIEVRFAQAQVPGRV